MGTTVGIVCNGTGFGWTVMAAAGDVEDHDIAAPKNLKDRGEILAWLCNEAKRVAELTHFDRIALQKAGTGRFNASPERIEVEAAVQIGLHHAGKTCERLNHDQVRKAMGLPKEKGAYESLLKLPDVKARSNPARRDQYLLAQALRQ